jgi:hypothetical protein
MNTNRAREVACSRSVYRHERTNRVRRAGFVLLAGLVTAMMPSSSFAWVLGTPQGDSCDFPIGIYGQGSFAFDNSTATTGAYGQNEANCKSFGTTGIGSDLWFSWTADLTGGVVLSLCASTGIDTKIAVYPELGCPVDGTSIGCVDDSCGLQSNLIFYAYAGQSFMIQVGTFPFAAGGVGTLDIDITPADFSGNYCTSSPNSVSSNGSRIFASGFLSLAAEQLTLIADNGTNQPAIFYFGPNQIAVPFGAGVRCVGGSTTRLPVFFGSGGIFEQEFDFQTYSLPVGPMNFQCWYRDPSGDPWPFNLSDAIQIDFIP